MNNYNYTISLSSLNYMSNFTVVEGLYKSITELVNQSNVISEIKHLSHRCDGFGSFGCYFLYFIIVLHNLHSIILKMDAL